jgi:transposase
MKEKSNFERQKLLFWYLGNGKSYFERQKVLFWYLVKGKSNLERQKVIFWYLGKGKSCFIILKSAFMSSYNVKIQFDSVEN